MIGWGVFLVWWRAIRLCYLSRWQAVAPSQTARGRGSWENQPDIHALKLAPSFQLYLPKIFSHKSSIAWLYRQALFNGHVFLNKAIKLQKMHCSDWIAFISKAHVKTHVINSDYFKLDARDGDWMNVKASCLHSWPFCEFKVLIFIKCLTPL